MPNVFDQFDTAPAANPFDQFDASPPGSPAKTDYVSPTDGNGFWQNALIGSGKFFTDMGLGARQIAAQPPTADLSVDENGNLVGTPHQITPQELLRVQQLQQEAADKRQIDAPINSTGGGKFGQIGTGLLTAIPLAMVPGANTYAGAALTGSGYGALTPTVAGESRATNTELGAGLGVAGKFGGDVLSRIFRPIASNLTGAQQKAAQAGANLGMRLTPGQRTGSTGLQQFEAWLESHPMTSGPVADLKSANQNALNQAWAQRIGESGTSLDSSVCEPACNSDQVRGEIGVQN